MKSSIQPKILVLALSGIGNLIMQIPTITALKKMYPEASLTLWIAPRGTRALAQNLPEVDQIIESPLKLSPPEHLQLITRLRREKFTIGIILSPGQLIKSAAYLWLSGIPRRVGSTYPAFGQAHTSWFLTNAVTELPNVHDIEQNLRLLAPLGQAEPHVPYYHIQPPPEAHAAAEVLWRALQLPPDVPIVGFHAGCHASMMWKRWPLENFTAVGQTLINQHHAHILLFGGPDERAQTEELQRRLGTSAHLISTSLLNTAAVLQRVQLFLSNDSGLMHLSAAVGTPTYGLFGPTDEQTTGPRGPKSYILRAPGTKPVYTTEHHIDLGQTAHPTMQAITVAQVLETITPALIPGGR